jgi:hypothetical protein
MLLLFIFTLSSSLPETIYTLVFTDCNTQENPDINWTTGKFKWRESVTMKIFWTQCLKSHPGETVEDILILENPESGIRFPVFGGVCIS